MADNDAKERLAEVVRIAHHERERCTGDPGTVLSPDGWCEREACADAMREILEAAGEVATKKEAM